LIARTTVRYNLRVVRLVSVLLMVALTAACSSNPPGPTPTPQPVTGLCGFSVSSADTTRQSPASGGQTSVHVTTVASGGVPCVWTVTVNDDARSFVTLVDPASGSTSLTDATVTFAVDPNSGGERRGTVLVAGVQFTIVQAAAACVLTLGGDLNATFPASGGTGHVDVTRVQGGSCPWTASAVDSFLTNVTPTSGTNNGTVTFTVAANSGGARTGRLTIAGQTVVVTQSAATTSGPSITGVSPSTVPLGSSLLTISGSGFDPATVQVAVIGGGCPAAAPCLVPNALLVSRSATTIVAPVTLNTAGTFTLQVQNGAAGPLSNAVPIVVAPITGPPPSIASLSPLSTSTGTTSLTINGSGFDPSTAQIAVSGPGCPSASPCIVPNSLLTTRTAAQIVGPVTLTLAGSYLIQVQNGAGGELSNGLTLTVNPAATPSIATLTPSTIPAGAASLTLDGANFDPATAQMVVTGPGCAAAAPCLVPNGLLTTRTTTRIVGPVTLTLAGSYLIQVQNGSGGAVSNAVTLTVR